MKKILGNKKAISTILAALLMVVIVVVASVMVYAWSTGLLGTLLVTPQTGQENLSMENYAFSTANAETVTLSLRNIGSATTSLVTYYVKNTGGSGAQYANTGYTTAAASPNTILTATITIGTICAGACTLTGTAYTFTSGSYEITVVTAKNQQFKFNVIK